MDDPSQYRAISDMPESYTAHDDLPPLPSSGVGFQDQRHAASRTSGGRAVSPSETSSARGSRPLSSALLQDLLSQKMAAGTGHSRRRRSEQEVSSTTSARSPLIEPAQDIVSPLDRRIAEATAGAAGMGARELERYLSTLHKQMFDLKLELHQRRQRMAAMEKELERTSQFEAQNAELQEINEQLLDELEKRDSAIGEAVDIICGFEDGVANALEAPLALPPLDDNVVVVPETPEHPKRAQDVRSPQPGGRSPHRIPSFLTSDAGSTSALRGLYLAGDFASPPSVRGTPSMMSFSPASQDPIPDGMDSPRLSVLSESSFLSVYGDRKGGKSRVKPLRITDRADDEHKDGEETHDKNKMVRSWMDRGAEYKPSRAGGRYGQFHSIGDILNSASSPRVSNKRPAPLQRSPEDPHVQGTVEKSQTEATTDGLDVTTMVMQGPMFGTGLLPPTPDTMSTAEHEVYNPSVSPIAEKSLFDGTRGPAVTLPNPAPSEQLRSASKASHHDAPAPVEAWTDTFETRAFDGEQESLDVQHDASDFGGLQMGESMWSRTAYEVRDMMFNGEGMEFFASSRADQSRPKSSSVKYSGVKAATPSRSGQPDFDPVKDGAITSSPAEIGPQAGRRPSLRRNKTTTVSPALTSRREVSSSSSSGGRSSGKAAPTSSSTPIEQKPSIRKWALRRAGSKRASTSGSTPSQKKAWHV
ncbi:MAG: hypothetical protein M1825_003978 [Sarcosagium campestre]|nr:MAG: hypothetical protein M1825_003978 [Sarcosagium campestre]